ncbi:MAG: helix-turn-helix transcriptional regulator [Chloroflexi bacterium]|nr:helix-turn-helix transcriptional regulator [Chloroflexota bacterium]
MQRFGEKLRTLRTRRGMTLQELAHELGFSSHSYISAIEFGKKLPSVTLVVKIANLFNISTDQLLKDDLDVD